MTEIGPKIQMCISCVFRVVFMRAMLIALVMGSAAQAGAWEEFEARCLVPMENVALAQPTDLDANKTFKNDGDTFSKYSLFDKTELWVSDGRAGHSQWCVVIEAVDVDWERLDAWVNTMIESGRYENVTGKTAHAPVTLRSTQWREPRIEIALQPLADSDGPSLSVRETDLES